MLPLLVRVTFLNEPITGACALLAPVMCIGALVAARPELALAVDPADLVYRQSTLIRGLRTLPVTL